MLPHDSSRSHERVLTAAWWDNCVVLGASYISCVDVYVYMYMYVDVHIYILMCVYMYMYNIPYILRSMMYICLHMYLHIYIHAMCIHIYMYLYAVVASSNTHGSDVPLSLPRHEP